MGGESQREIQETLEGLCLRIPPEELDNMSGEMEVRTILITLLTLQPEVREERSKDGWMDGWMGLKEEALVLHISRDNCFRLSHKY